jgi:hypothetical protein
MRLGRMSKTEPLDDGAAFRQGASQFKVSFRQLREEFHRSDWAQKNVLIAVPGAEADGTSGMRDANDKTLRQESPPRARVARTCARVLARISSPTRDAVFYSGSTANPFEFRHLTARKCAYIEEQRMRNVAGAFARLRRALDNTARPTWGQSTPERLAYLQAKFDRRVSDPGSRMAAATLIEEWRQRSMTGLPNLEPEPMSQITDGELMAAISERQYGQSTPEADRPPPPSKPARMPRKPRGSRTSTEPPVLPSGANELRSNVDKMGSSP